MNSAAAIIERLKTAMGMTRSSTLADALGVSRQAVSNWKARGKVDPDVVMRFARQEGLSLSWVFDGDGPMRVSDAPTTTIPRASPERMRELGVQHLPSEGFDSIEHHATPESVAALVLRRTLAIIDAKHAETRAEIQRAVDELVRHDG